MSAVKLDALDESVRDYAGQLMAAGFTVYAPGPDTARPARAPRWFHYERGGFFGTFSGEDGDADHTMPLSPSRLNGSGAFIGGVEVAGVDPLTVEMAALVARATNWCPYNVEPTPEATARADAMRPTPKSWHKGARLANARPWGIGTHYLPVEL